MDFSPLFAKKILFVTGKGGIGKTLLTAALGHAAAMAGRKVCLVESAPRSQLAPLLGVDGPMHTIVPVSSHLSVFNINAELNFRDFIVLHLGFEKIFETVFSKGIVRSFTRMIPGIAELTLLGRLYYLVELAKDERFDLAIVDSYASGHFLSLMTTPDAIINAGLTGPVLKETERVRTYLHDPRTAGMMVVATPRELVVNETVEFLAAFRARSPVRCEGVLLNRAAYLPSQLGTAEMTAVKAMAGSHDPWQAYVVAQIEETHQAIAALREAAPPAWLAALPELGSVREPWRAKEAMAWLTSGEEIP